MYLSGSAFVLERRINMSLNPIQVALNRDPDPTATPLLDPLTGPRLLVHSL